MKKLIISLALSAISTPCFSKTSTLPAECPKIFHNSSFEYKNTKINKVEWANLSFGQKKGICKDNLNKRPEIDWSKKQELSEICSFYFHRKLPISDITVSQKEWDQTLEIYSAQQTCNNKFSKITKTHEQRIRKKIRDLIINSVYKSKLHIFYKHDFSESEMISCKAKKINPDLLTFIDQEGGGVFNIENPKTIPINPKHYDKYTPEDIYANAKKVARELKKHCVDVNLAPVVDKYSRGYDWYVHDNTKHLEAFSKGMSDGGVVPTFKHFPGCTFTQKNISSKDHPFYNDSMVEGLICKERYKGELLENLPLFRLTDYSVVMMSNNIYPNYSTKPAPTEALYYDWLRNKLNFKGLIITDSLDTYSLNKDFVVTVFKNNDALMTTSRDQIHFIEDSIWEAYLDGLISEEYIDLKIDKINNFFYPQDKN